MFNAGHSVTVAQANIIRTDKASKPVAEGFPQHGSSPVRPFRVLFLKPYQDLPTLLHAPPLGLLYLVSALRQYFGNAVSIDLIDMKAHYLDAEWLIPRLDEFKPDVVGVSAMNYEAAQSHRIADIVKKWDPSALTMLGGAYALHQSAEIFKRCSFDWIIEGPAERTLLFALERYLQGKPLGEDLPGLSYRMPDGQLVLSTSTDVIKDVDSLPLPAWDMVDFDLYASRPWDLFMKPRRYATIFTSRGCPYLCNYCHDMFSKKFVHRSVGDVLREMELLHEKYGVDDFQIVDDIFNLHKPRLKEIMGEVKRRWGGKIQFGFPNGLRADIMDGEVIKALADGGTYYTAVAIETVTPRLQALVEKHLDVEKTRRSIDMLEEHGISVKGFFMLGFPTETVEELNATVNFALQSKMSMASFFTVVPQPGTPLYDLAAKENRVALDQVCSNELEGGGAYRSNDSWYQLAYGYSLSKLTRSANWRFYFGHPRRIAKLLKRSSWLTILRSFRSIFNVLLPFRIRRSSNK
jgi:anaerobic magnesium-protoporphyrin IX monomethyl ester cyclase